MRSSGLFIMANMHLKCEVEDLDFACTYMDRQQTEFVQLHTNLEITKSLDKDNASGMVDEQE